MKKKNLLIISVLTALTMIAASCGPRVEPTPTVDPQSIMTEVAQTISAELTEVALLTPSPTATMPATQTPPPLPTQALPPATTQSGQLPAQPLPSGPLPDDWTYISDNIPDGTVYWANEKFTIRWKIENTGTTTWTSDYQLVFFDGTQMGDITVVSLTSAVEPGVQIEIPVPMVAPSQVGKTYRSWWAMYNDKGEVFPVNEYLWVEIYVGTEFDKTPTPAG